jgi:cytochrome b561
MTLRNTTSRYGTLSISLHWLMLLLIAAVYVCMELRGIFPKGSAGRDGMKTWHYMLGLSVLVLAAIRLVLTLTSPMPRIEPPPGRWVILASHVSHAALYAFMLLMPILGWLLLSGEGDPVPFFGLDLPPLAGADKAFAKSVKELHETIGNLGYYLIGLHAAAALFHHYFQHDNTLTRMLPTRR